MMGISTILLILNSDFIRNLPGVIFIVLIVNPEFALSTEFSCPESISVPPPTITAPEGWRPVSSTHASFRLKGLEVAQSDISIEWAVLIPHVVHQSKRFVATWDLKSYELPASRFSISCEYENTTMTLRRQLTDAVSQCRFEATDTGDGQARFPMHAECR